MNPIRQQQIRQIPFKPISNPGGMGFWQPQPDGSFIGGDSFTGQTRPIGWNPQTNSFDNTVYNQSQKQPTIQPPVGITPDSSGNYTNISGQVIGPNNEKVFNPPKISSPQPNYDGFLSDGSPNYRRYPANQPTTQQTSSPISSQYSSSMSRQPSMSTPRQNQLSAIPGINSSFTRYK